MQAAEHSNSVAFLNVNLEMAKTTRKEYEKTSTRERERVRASERKQIHTHTHDIACRISDRSWSRLSKHKMCKVKKNLRKNYFRMFMSKISTD